MLKFLLVPLLQLGQALPALRLERAVPLSTTDCVPAHAPCLGINVALLSGAWILLSCLVGGNVLIKHLGVLFCNRYKMYVNFQDKIGIYPVAIFINSPTGVYSLPLFRGITRKSRRVSGSMHRLEYQAA